MEDSEDEDSDNEDEESDDEEYSIANMKKILNNQYRSKASKYCKIIRESQELSQYLLLSSEENGQDNSIIVSL